PRFRLLRRPPSYNGGQLPSGSVQRAPRSQVVVPGGRGPRPPRASGYEPPPPGRHAPLPPPDPPYNTPPMSEGAQLLARIRFVVKSVVANVVKKISPKNTQLSLPGLTRQSIRFAKCPYEDDGPAGQARGRRAEDCGPPFFVIAGHSASKTRVNALMTRQSIRLRKMPLGLAKKMDPRVKPAGDACGTDPVASPSGRTQRRLPRSYGAGVNGAATHVEGAHAACGGAGGVRGLERRRPPPPSRLLRRVRRAQPIELRRLAARPRHPKSGTGSRARQRARSSPRS